MVNAEKWGAKVKKWGRCQLANCLTLCVVSLVFPTFSVFKVVYHEHPFALSLSAISVMPQSQEHILGWPYLRQIKSYYHGWQSMKTSSEGPPF